MIPYPTPQFEYDRPPEYGGLLTVYPIVTKDQQHGLLRETQVSWYGYDSGIWQTGGRSTIGIAAWADKRSFSGEVWTLQQTNNEPGYYTTPHHIEVLADERVQWDSGGVRGSDWVARLEGPYA